MKLFNLTFASLASVVLAGCMGSGDGNADLHKFIGEVKARKASPIEPLHEFVPYETFVYASTTLHSPFVPPVKKIAAVGKGVSSNVKPDQLREKEYLEGFQVSSLAMVGTMSRAGQMWALIRDGSGGVHRVQAGNYLGENHGKIISIDSATINILEIVSNGADGWIERPQILQIVEKD